MGVSVAGVVVVGGGTGTDEGLLQATITSIIRPKQDFIFYLIFSKEPAIIIFLVLLYSLQNTIMDIQVALGRNYMCKEWAVVIKTAIILLLFYNL
jgi:hypothetical protein